MAGSVLTAAAQDHQYSQFFNAPVYLNPALNGQFEGDLRMNLIYRNQWTSLPGSPRYFTASIDYNIPQFGGGIGLMFTHGTEGASYLTKDNISGIYSYSVGSEGFVLSFGLQAGVTSRSINIATWFLVIRLTRPLVLIRACLPTLSYLLLIINSTSIPARASTW